MYGVFIHPTIWIRIINSRCAYILYTKQPLKICVCVHYQRVDSYIHHVQYIMKQSIVLILKKHTLLKDKQSQNGYIYNLAIYEPERSLNW